MLECIVVLLLAPASDGTMAFLVQGAAVKRNSDSVLVDFEAHMRKLAKQRMITLEGPYVRWMRSADCWGVEYE